MILTENQASRISSDGLIHDAERLKELQALPLERKVGITQARIAEWYNHYNGNVYVSFSGGKDSSVLLSIARSMFPDIKAVYVDTGLEYPEVKEFIRSFDNVEVLRPKMTFRNVITQYGYPLISKEVAECIYYARRHIVPPCNVHANVTSNCLENAPSENCRTSGRETARRIADLLGCRERESNNSGLSQFNKTKWLPLAQQAPFLISHKCCNVMKKAPVHSYLNKSGMYPILGTMASESRMRKQSWIRNGCNGFSAKNPTSQPMAFWTENDVLMYIKLMNIQIPSVYGEIFPVDYKGRNANESGCKICKWATTGCSRTGCVYCAFGFNNERGLTRFQSLAQTHPKLYDYCINGGQWIDNPYYIPNLSTDIDIHLDIGWNPKKIWAPSKDGLGMGKVFDICNEIYGEDFYRYK